jgi:hypothetical protein
MLNAAVNDGKLVTPHPITYRRMTMSTLTSGHGGNAPGLGKKSVLRVLVGTGAILLLPLLAMQFTGEVNWTALDFVVASVLLLGVGFALELAVGKLANMKQRLLWIAAIVLAFVYLWAELAVGIFFHFGS